MTYEWLGARGRWLQAFVVAAFLAPTSSLAAVAVNKSFTPDTVSIGELSTLTVLLLNPNPDPATGAAFTDTLPASVTVASPANATTTCGGVVAATPGAAAVSLTGGTIPAKSGDTPGRCQVTVTVVSGTVGSHINSIGSGAITSSEGTNGQGAQATLSVPTLEPIVGTKLFAAANLHGNGPPTTVTIGLLNHNGVSLTGVAFTDTLPANVVVATPANAATTCGGGVLTASPGTGTVSLANATMAHDSSCTVTFDVIASPATAFVDATRTNTIATVSNVQGAQTTSFSTTVRVQAGAQVAKAFSPSTISNGGVATLTLTLRNFNATPLTPLDITDALPGGMTIANPAAAATTCPGGAVTGTPGGASLSLSGGTLAAAPTGVGSTACTVSVNVTAANTGTTPLTLTNPVPAGNFGGVSYAATSAALVVNPVTVISGSKAFSPTSRVQTQVTTLTITLTNASGTAAGITSVTDNLTTMGTGFTVAASPAATTTCGGTVTALPGTTAITMVGGSIPAHGSCQIIVPVQVGATASTGTRPNTIAVGAIQTDQGSNGTAITANLTVSAALAVSKAFVPATVTTGGVTRLTITLTHANGAPTLSNIAVTDTLPAGHVISPTPNATTTCGGTVTATAGSGSVSLAGGALGTGSTTCQIQVNVTVPTSVPSGSSAQATNTIAANAVTTAEGVTNAVAASATITRTLAFLTLGKSFSPLAVEPGVASTMTITIVNTNTGAISLTGVNLTDVFPLGLVVANPPNAGLTGVDCTGIVSAPVGATALGLSGGTIAAGARCELKVNVTPTAVGNLVNILPPGVITTAQGPTNLSQVVATLAATGRADVRVQKTPSVPNVAPGGTVIYTITVSNAGPDNIAGALFTDPVPAGMTFTAWTCAAPAGAACTAAGSGAISDSVTIPKGSSVVYTVTAVVAPTSTGSITNTATVDVPSLVVDPDESNNSATTTTPITPPVLTLTKSATPASFVVGTPANYTIVVVNSGPLATTLVATVTDDIPASLTPGAMPAGCSAAGNHVTCTIPAGLASGGTASFIIPVTPTVAGQAVNTASVSGGGDPGCPQTARCRGTVTTNIDVAQLRVNKEATPVSFVVGVPASYTLTVFNEGTLATSAPATVTDPLPGSLQLGALPSGCVAVGQQVTCTIPPPLPAGAVVAFVIPVTPTASGSLVNTATVSGGGDPTCPAGAPARCQSTVTTAVGAPQLRISKQAAPASFVVNGDASYTLTVVNEGTAATTAVSTVADDVPDSFALGTLPEGCAAALNRVTCTVPPGLTPGHGVSFIIPVTPTATGTFVDTATVSGGGDPGCPQDVARCSASIATAADAPQLRLGKLASPPSFTVGVEGRYVLTVFNEGTAATTAATTVVDTVPGAFTLGAMPSGCVATGQEVRCTLPAGLAPGGAAAFVIPVTPTAAGSFVNVATLSGGGDPSCPPVEPDRCGATITTDVDGPQLRIVKLAVPASFVVGAQANYVITVFNQGSAATTAPTTLADNVPGSLGLGAMPAGCVASGQQVTCTIPTGFAPGASVSFEIPVTPALSVAGESLVNTATVTGGGDSGCPQSKPRCESSVTTAIDAPQLRITKDATPVSFSVGVEGVYTLQVVNEGTGRTTAPARVFDNVPATFVVGQLPPDCQVVRQGVGCRIPPGLEPGEKVTFAIPVTPTAAGAFANSARVSGGGDPGCLPSEPSRCEATIITTVNQPQLVITKAATPPSFTVNVPASYTITVLNEGTAVTTAPAVVADNIPESLTLGEPPAGCTAVGHAVLCLVPQGLAPGASASFVIPVTPTVTGVPVTNTATVSGGGDPGCRPVAVSRCEATITTAVDGPQLRLTKSLDTNLVVNAPASYTLSVLNEGTAPTTAPAVVADSVPLTFTLGALPAGCAAVQQQVVCVVPAGLAPSASVNFVIPVTPTISGSFINSARVVGGGDPGCPPARQTRCESSIDMEVAGPQLTAFKQAPPSFVVGVSSSYNIGVVNRGNAPTTAAVTVTDDVPSTLRLGALPSGCSASGQAVTCTVPAGLAPGDVALFVIAVTPTVGGGSVTNTATVSGGGDPACPDPNRPRCSATVVTPVNTVDLLIRKQATPVIFRVGDPASYTITVTNQGSTATVSPITVTDTVPATLLVGAPPAGCGAVGNQVTCTVPAGLAPLTSTSFVIPVTATTTGVVTNTATISGSEDPRCPAAPNCSSTIDTAVVSQAVLVPLLSVTKEATTATFSVGVPFAYTITVTNEGTAPTTADATVTDNVPANFALGTLPPGCTAVGQSVSCLVPAGLPAGAQVVFTLSVTPAVASASVSNTATLSGGGDVGCPTAARCTSTVVVSGEVGPIGGPQLRLTKTASPSSFVPGEPLSFTLTVVNEGTAPTTSVATVTDTLPGEVTLVGPPAGCAASGQIVTCIVAAGLAPGGVATFVLPVVVSSSASGNTIHNVASVGGGGDTVCPSDARCSAALDVPPATATAIPVSSPAALALMALILTAFGLWRMRGRTFPGI